MTRKRVPARRVSSDERARSRSKKHDAAVLRTAARKNGGKSTSASFAVAGKLPHSATLRTIGLKEVGLAEFRGKNVVILFYPLDWTPG